MYTHGHTDGHCAPPIPFHRPLSLGEGGRLSGWWLSLSDGGCRVFCPVHISMREGSEAVRCPVEAGGRRGVIVRCPVEGVRSE